jgi:acyl-CoA thioesterase I
MPLRRIKLTTSTLMKHTLLFMAAIFTMALSLRLEAVTPVACVGDSITAGSGLASPQSESWPARLGELLGPSYQVKNFGVSGATLLKNGNKPYWKVSAFAAATQFQPDIVIIALGGNDSKSINWDPHQAEFAADAHALIDHFASLPSAPKIYLSLPTPAFSKAFGVMESNNERIRVILREVGKSRHLTIIDLYSAMRDEPTLFRDGVHPLASGADKIAQTVKAVLVQSKVVEEHSGSR